MANTTQSAKRARQNEKRFAINKARRSRIHTYIRKVILNTPTLVY